MGLFYWVSVIKDNGAGGMMPENKVEKMPSNSG
jgi:hypothetical protein